MTPAANLLNQEQLSQWCGYTRRADLIAWLEARNIRYEIGKDGKVCSTVQWITANNNDILLFDAPPEPENTLVS